MKEINIITKPSADLAFMNVAVEWNGLTATLDSCLPNQIEELKSSVEAFTAIAKDIIVDNYEGGVKISSPNIRLNASKLYNLETGGQEIVDMIAYRLAEKRQSLVAQ